MTDRVGIGVIGVGLMGRRHAQNATRIAETRLIAVVDAARPVAERVAADLGAVAARSVEELVARDDVRVVVVASPSRHHAGHAIAALEAGKDVLLEKPMALTLADCDRVIAAARGGARLQIGFMRRYDPPYAEAHRLIGSGALGEPVLFKSASRDRDRADRPAAEGIAMSLLESAIHDLDLARWLLADEVRRVNTVAAAVCHGGTCVHAPNAMLTALELARGGIAGIETYHGARYAYDIRSEVVCAEGTVVVGEERSGRLAVLRPTGEPRADDPGFLERFADAYLAELADFVSGARERRPPAITAADGKAAVAIALAGAASFAAGRAEPVAPIS